MRSGPQVHPFRGLGSSKRNLEYNGYFEWDDWTGGHWLGGMDDVKKGGILSSRSMYTLRECI